MYVCVCINVVLAVNIAEGGFITDSLRHESVDVCRNLFAASLLLIDHHPKLKTKTNTKTTTTRTYWVIISHCFDRLMLNGSVGARCKN